VSREVTAVNVQVLNVGEPGRLVLTAMDDQYLVAACDQLVHYSPPDEAGAAEDDGPH
jgi:hypothetical protein